MAAALAGGNDEAAARSPVLRLSGITKRFGPLLANDSISLRLQAGEVLALLGENGAGKSTLMSILFGHYRADAGEIEVFGKPLPPGDPRLALAAGIGMVHQHFTLADNLGVLDNVMLGSESMWRLRSGRGSARARLLEVANRFGLNADPDARVASLSVGERQRVEILKALFRGARILILDEPTAVLTPQESEGLFDTLAQMVREGLSIIFISHKLDEVLRVSHRVAVLRGGRLVAEFAAAGTTQAALAQAMVGHAVAPPRRRPADTARRGETVCTLERVCTDGAADDSHESYGPDAPRSARAATATATATARSTAPAATVFPSASRPASARAPRAARRDALRGASLELHAGEIVAIAGVSGNGQLALAELLCGTRAASSGVVRLLGRPLRASPAWLVQQGIARIPEDRASIGVVGDLPLWENAVSERLRGSRFLRGPLVRRAAARLHARRIVEAFDVRGGGLDIETRSLSGGNMQKLILGRALLAPDGQGVCRLIVAHQPTWGLDIGAVAYVHDQLIAARDAGAAVLVISDDLDEVMVLGDRIAVMHAGRLGSARPAGQWQREAIGLAMAGGGHEAGAA